MQPSCSDSLTTDLTYRENFNTISFSGTPPRMCKWNPIACASFLRKSFDYRYLRLATVHAASAGRPFTHHELMHSPLATLQTIHYSTIEHISHTTQSLTDNLLIDILALRFNSTRLYSMEKWFIFVRNTSFPLSTNTAINEIRQRFQLWKFRSYIVCIQVIILIRN